MDRRIERQAALVPVVVAGAGEGAVLGYAQSRVLRRELPALDRRGWVRVTAAAAALSWAIGMTPSAFHHELSRWPPPLLVALAVSGGAVLLCSIGAAQATMLRRHVDHSGRWIGANAAGWLAGLPIPFIALALAPDESPAMRVGIALATGLGMGVTVAAITGATLVRLLMRPRVRPPASLCQRARVHLNLAHAWIYARTNGRAGGRIARFSVLLLTTTGRRTGHARRTPVQYQRLDGELVIVAAGGGASEPPNWWRNIEADPHVTVQLGHEQWPALAIPAGGAQREALWQQLCEHNRFLEGLECKAGRKFPVIRVIRSGTAPTER